jgi:hypothetical protein
MEAAREQAVIQALRRPASVRGDSLAGGSLIRSPRWLEPKVSTISGLFQMAWTAWTVSDQSRITSGSGVSLSATGGRDATSSRRWSWL